MKNINEEVKRMRVLMGLNENIQHNNFAQMGLTRKTISRGWGHVSRTGYRLVVLIQQMNQNTEFDKEVEWQERMLLRKM